MANLLNFNSNRDLGFNHVRELQFDLNRTLDFDLNRDLVFNPNRDLGFGKRGVLFRGYTCPNCGAIVSVDATSCGECGATFDQPTVRGVMKAAPAQTAAFERASAPARDEAPPSRPARAPEPAPRPPQPEQRTAAPPQTPAGTRTAPGAPSGSASRFCASCGARSWQGDAFCWNCGARFTSGANPGATGTRIQAPATTETIQLPPRKARKVTKDWQETDKGLDEYAEEK